LKIHFIDAIVRQLQIRIASGQLQSSCIPAQPQFIKKKRLKFKKTKSIEKERSRLIKAKPNNKLTSKHPQNTLRNRNQHFLINRFTNSEKKKIQKWSALIRQEKRFSTKVMKEKRAHTFQLSE
jgi:hypothetical protein